MKLRVTGTMDEIDAAKDYYTELERSVEVKFVSISKPYPCRESKGLFRLYVEVQFKNLATSGALCLKGKVQQ
jgi:hypothetical protein